MRSSTNSLAIVFASVLALACKNDQGPLVNARVSVQDQCDPASFNAALGPGTCTKQGAVTFQQFNAELNATQRVAAWQFVPAAFTIRVGEAIVAKNDGGELHTFTEVDKFGGGIVPALNTASGNTTEAPECAALTARDNITSGMTFTTDAATTVGVEHYQCCIHPWMRATVTVER